MFAGWEDRPVLVRFISDEFDESDDEDQAIDWKTRFSHKGSSLTQRKHAGKMNVPDTLSYTCCQAGTNPFLEVIFKMIDIFEYVEESALVHAVITSTTAWKLFKQ